MLTKSQRHLKKLAQTRSLYDNKAKLYYSTVTLFDCVLLPYYFRLNFPGQKKKKKRKGEREREREKRENIYRKGKKHSVLPKFLC